MLPRKTLNPSKATSEVCQDVPAFFDCQVDGEGGNDSSGRRRRHRHRRSLQSGDGPKASITIDFNDKVDSDGNDHGVLKFHGDNGFVVYFTDDESNGSSGGQAEGVEITNKNYGNIKVNSATDYVLGAFNSPWTSDRSYNYHSSGVRAVFNQGVTKPVERSPNTPEH